MFVPDREYRCSFVQRTLFTSIVIKMPDGRTEVIHRATHADPHVTARTFEALTGGKVISVRHEQVQETGTNRRTVAIHRMG